MTKLKWILPIGVLAGLATCGPPPDDSVTAYENANIWMGEAYEARTLYVKEGVFADAPEGGAGVSVDLSGLLVTQPFGEAHNHNVENPLAAPLISARYAAFGIFYMKNPNNMPGEIPETRKVLAGPETIDVVWAMGGLTESRGHPERLYVDMLAKQAYPGNDRDSFEGNAYHWVGGEKSVEDALDMLEAQGADFVKTYLLDSDNYEARSGDDEQYGNKGLSPEMLAEAVTAAHARGLRVVTHIETANDLQRAVTAGVDEVNHLPGYFWWEGTGADDYRISDETIASAAESGTSIVTTTLVSPMAVYRNNPERLAEVQALQAENLQRLYAGGVPIAIGSDTFFATSYEEAKNLQEIGAFDGPTLLNLWTATPKLSIFPDRNIGCFDIGCEASFAAFVDDPSKDISAVETLQLAIKQGAVLVDNRAED